MAAYLGDPGFDHARSEGTLILLVNLGTPDAPTTPAVRRYLAEFLSDPRVIELPAPVRWLLLHGIVLRFRPPRTAAAYRKVWQDSGSPLLSIGLEQARALNDALGQAGWNAPVRLAMRYGQPSIANVLSEFRGQGLKRLLVVPLYPQYSGSTTGSVMDALGDELKRWRRVPELRVVAEYHDQPAYIEALAEQVRDADVPLNDEASHLLLSFHGLPQRYLRAGDPYYCHCHATARLVREALGASAERVSVSFQSRVGREPWLQPYTDERLAELAGAGVRHLYVSCPGFAADCLETLEEIEMVGRDQFLAAGGESFTYIGALNTRPAHVRALTDLVWARTHDWRDTAPADTELEARAARAETDRAANWASA